MTSLHLIYSLRNDRDCRSNLRQWQSTAVNLVHEHSALPGRTVCGFRRSKCQPSAVERLRSQQRISGTGFLTMSRRANSLSAFRQQLTCTLFQQSFPDIIIWHFLTVTPLVVLAVTSLRRPLYKLIDWTKSGALQCRQQLRRSHYDDNTVRTILYAPSVDCRKTEKDSEV